MIDTDDLEISSFLKKHPEIWYIGQHYIDFKISHGTSRKNDLEEMKKDLADLKEKVLALWYSPGMPGYMLAQERFEHAVNDQDAAPPETR